MVSELPETVPFDEMVVTNSANSASSISWVIGPSRTMVRDSSLISISSSSSRIGRPKSGPSDSRARRPFRRR